jgi:DNA invertase Pin-like site-specific DNA recombinase
VSQQSLTSAHERLARSIADLCAIVAKIEAKGASLRILARSLDTATPTGRLMLNMLRSIAQFERELMLERQRQGIAKAKAEGPGADRTVEG